MQRPASGIHPLLERYRGRDPAGKIIHVILDNYGPHKHPKTRAWLGRHPRFTFHYTPTSASWLNAVEGFFAKLTKRRLRRGVFCSIVDLQAAINRFLRVRFRSVLHVSRAIMRRIIASLTKASLTAGRCS